MTAQGRHSGATAAGDAAGFDWRGYRTYALLVISGIAFLNGCDNSIMGAVSSKVQQEFRLTDTAVGILGSTYIVVYALAVLPFGLWADAGMRRRVIAAGVAVWSICTFAGGLAATYLQLLVARSGVGIGEASYLPASNSLIGDLYPREERGWALSWVASAFRAGIGIGVLGGGLVAAWLGWRAAFFFAGLPGLAMALVALRLREPLRGSTEAVHPKLSMSGDYDLRSYWELVKIPTLVAVILSVTCGLFVTAGIGYWTPLFVQRHFGVGVGPAAAITGLPLLIGGVGGTLLGGRVADWLARSRASGPLEVSAAGFLAGGVFMLVALRTSFLPLFIGGWLLGLICLAFWFPALQAMTQSVVIPIRRATAMTLVLLVGNLIGNATAPSAIGLVSDRLGDLGGSLAILVLVMALLGALAALAGVRFAARDSRRMETDWAAAVQGAFASRDPASDPPASPDAGRGAA